MESPSGQQFGSSQMCLNGVPSSTDEVTGSAATTTNNAAAEPQQPPLHHHQHHQHPHQQQQQYHNQPPQPYLDHLEQQRHNNTNMRMSTCSSNDGSSSCPLTHQYHYIQYPAYYQLMNDRLQSQQQQQQQQEQELPPPTCRCPCSCGRPQGNLMAPNIPPTTNNSNSNSNTNALSGRHAHQLSDDSQMAVDVIVHRQAGGGGVVDNQQVGPGTTKSKSEQSLLDHSYQALQQGDLHSGYGDEEKQLNVAETTSCDCDLECTCEPALPAKSKPFGGGGGGAGPGGAGMSAMMLGADEITVSESDNNSATVNRKSRDALSGGKKSKPWCSRQDNLIGGGRGRKSSDDLYNSSQIDIYSDGDGDGDGDGTDSCLKMHNGGLSEDEQRPPLPPRPPPRPRNVIVNMNAHRNGTGIKKYVVWCLICGGFSCLLGVLFLGVYFLLHSYTITVGNFETVPTFVPATLLILTGLCIMSLARRRNRYSYLIKLSGACGLISALTCALVTVTTTVLHMSRLQALRECEYAQKTRTCTCYSDLIESQVERVDKGVRLVFDSLSDCGVVHGSLYSCLRAIFGLSVAGVLIAVFSCMLVYQLLSHERKKMYWEQLELRCRSLYTSQQGPPPPNMAAMAGGRGNGCRCCEQCHAHRQVPLQPSAYPWDDGAEPRFWTGQPPGNFYSPNPGGDDLHNSGGAAPGGGCRGGHGLSNSRSRMTGWSWPRMPWQRSSPVNNTRFRQTPSSPDSQYGFSNSAPPPNEAAMGTDEMLAPTGVHPGPGGFNVVVPGNLPYGVWGPPPPYSDPNSPARRGYYHYVHPNAPCLGGQSDRQSVASSAEPHQARLVDCRPHRGPGQGPFLDSQSSANAHDAGFCGQASSMRNLGKRQSAVGGNVGFASKGGGGGDYENTPSDSDGGAARDRFSNTLPTRKLKKRVEAGAKSIGPNSHSHAPATQRVNVQHVFPGANCGNEGGGGGGGGNEDEHDYHEPMMNPNAMGGGVGGDNNLAQPTCLNGRAAGQRHQLGVENSGFQSSAECNTVEGHGHGHDHGGHVHGHGHGHENCDPAESEVYFADVSSCCNMSVKNDNYYEDANQPSQPPSVKHSNCHNHPSHSHSHNHNAGSNSSQSPAVAAAAVANDEDYLAQRFGKRENSIRSRLPFPQSCGDDYERNLNMATTAANGPAPSNGTITSPPSSSGPMQKEMSRQSMCSVESEAKTEFTDLSPSTPCTNKFAQVPFGAGMTGAAPPGPGYCNTTAGPTPGGHCEESATNNRLAPPTFIASSYPYSSESQSLEAHRRSTRNINEHMLAPEAQYEVINDAPAPGKAAMPSFPVSPSGRTAAKGNQRPTTLRTHNAQNVAKNGAKNVAAYQSDVEWSDSSSCPNDRQHL